MEPYEQNYLSKYNKYKHLKKIRQGFNIIVEQTKQDIIENFKQSTYNFLQIKFHSISSKLKLKEIKLIEIKLIDKILGERKSANRIFFTRHFDTGKGLSGKKQKVIKEKEQSKIDKIISIFQKYGINQNNFYAFCNNDTTRAMQTLYWIVNKIFPKKLGRKYKISHKVIGLETTDKDIENINQRSSIVTKNATDFFNCLKNRLEHIEGLFLNLIIHKSTIGAIGSTFFDDKTSSEIIDITSGITDIAPGQMIEIDLNNQAKGIKHRYFQKYLDIKAQNYGLSTLNNKNLDLLFINNINFEEIIKILEINGDLQDIIGRFKKHKITIVDLQNYLNAYFLNDVDQIMKLNLLISKNLNLRIFALANLIKHQKFVYIKDNFKEFINQYSPNDYVELGKIIIAVNNNQIYDLFLDELKKPLNRELKTAFMELLKFNNFIKKNTIPNNIKYFFDNETTQDLIDQIKIKSFDDRICRGDNIDISFRFQTEDKILEKHINTNLDNILLYGQNIKYIEAEGGSGKSLLIHKLVKKLQEKNYKLGDNEFNPIFINLSYINDFNKILETINYYQNNVNNLYIFDSLDECKLNNEDKKKLFKLIAKLGDRSQILIESRPGYRGLNGEVHKIDYLQINPFTQEEQNKYVGEYLNFEIEDEKTRQLKLNKWHQIRDNNFIKSISSNPLNLSFICQILKTNSDKYIDTIDNSEKFYEKFIELKLSKKDMENKIVENNDNIKFSKLNSLLLPQVLEAGKNLIGEIAYEGVYDNGILNTTQVDKIISQDPYKLLFLTKNEHINYEKLEGIFHITEKGEFIFRHEKLKEYCFIMSIINKIKQQKEGFKDEELFILFKFLNYSNIDLFSDILTKNNHYLELVNILIKKIEKIENINEERLLKESLLQNIDYIVMNTYLYNKLKGKNVDKNLVNEIFEFYSNGLYSLKSTKQSVSFQAILFIIFYEDMQFGEKLNNISQILAGEGDEVEIINFAHKYQAKRDPDYEFAKSNINKLNVYELNNFIFGLNDEYFYKTLKKHEEEEINGIKIAKIISKCRFGSISDYISDDSVFLVQYIAIPIDRGDLTKGTWQEFTIGKKNNSIKFDIYALLQELQQIEPGWDISIDNPNIIQSPWGKDSILSFEQVEKIMKKYINC